MLVRHPRRGFTLLEIVVTVGIALVLTSIGIGLSDEMIPRFRTRKAAMTLSSHMQQCRNIAVRSGRECSIWMLSYDSDLTSPETNYGEYWVGLGDSSLESSSWDYLPIDAEDDGSDDSRYEGTIDLADEDSQYYSRRVSISDWGTITGPGSGNSNRIVFNSRGFVSNPVGDFTDGHITITFVNEISNAKGRAENFSVILSRSGMSRVNSTEMDRYDGLASGTPTSSSESD